MKSISFQPADYKALFRFMHQQQGNVEKTSAICYLFHFGRLPRKIKVLASSIDKLSLANALTSFNTRVRLRPEVSFDK